jgi:hypothetical protein
MHPATACNALAVNGRRRRFSIVMRVLGFLADPVGDVLAFWKLWRELVSMR